MSYLLSLFYFHFPLAACYVYIYFFLVELNICVLPILFHFGRSPHFWFGRCSLKFFLSSMSNSSIGLSYSTFHALGLFTELQIRIIVSSQISFFL